MSGIVIIEDDRLMSDLLRECLAQAGYAVRPGTLHDPPPLPAADLVIFDLYMPRQGGTELVHTVKALYPDTPLIAVSCQFHSGLSEAGAIAQALGVERVIAKPFKRDALLDAVHAVIGAPEEP